IKGVDERSIRQAIAYKREDGTYDYYEVTAADPGGDKATKIPKLTRDQVIAKMTDQGHTVQTEASTELKPSRAGLQGWKDGRWQFGAIALKDKNGNETGQWRVTTGPDLSDKSQPRTKTTFDDFEDVRKMFGDGGYSRTKKVEAAKQDLQDRSGL